MLFGAFSVFVMQVGRGPSYVVHPAGTTFPFSQLADAWPWIFGNILPLHLMRQIGFAMFVAGVIR